MIRIGKRIISKKSKPLIVAEIGINHFGSLRVAKKIVDEAKKNNAEAIKVFTPNVIRDPFHSCSC